MDKRESLKILITGASGFVGNYLFHGLGSEFDVRGLSFSSKSDGLDTLDLRNQIELSNYMMRFQPSIVIHCAAKVPRSNNQKELEEIRVYNKSIDRSIINSCKDHNSKLLYFSSAYIYERQIGEYPLAENSVLNLANGYFKGKWDSEELIRSTLNNFVILRLSSPTGLKRIPVTVFDFFLNNALKGEPIRILDNPMRVQDFISLYDIQSSILSLIHKSISSRTLNLTSGYSTSLLNLAEAIKTETHSNSAIEIKRSYDAKLENNRFDNSKLLKITGKSMQDINSIIRETLNENRGLK